MPSKGGWFGSGFAQGFGQSLQILPQIMRAREERELQKEELSLKKAILDKQDKLLQLKLNQVGQMGPLLQQLLGGGGGVQPQSSAAPSPTTPLQDAVSGGGADSAAPSPPSSLPPDLSLPSPTPAASSTTAPMMQAQGQPQQPQGTQSPYQLDGVTMDPFNMSMSLKIGRKQMKGETQPVMQNGSAVFMNVIRDDQGNIVKAIPIPQMGQPRPPAEIEKLQSTIRSWGGANLPDSAVNALAGQLNGALELPDPNQKTAALLQVQRQAQQLGNIVLQQGEAGKNASFDLQAPDLAGAVEEGRKAAVSESAKKSAADTAARQTAENQTKPLQGAEQTKFNTLSSVERTASLASELYKPEYVGKGFGKFAKDVKAGVEGGAIGGALREFTGDISPEEIQFRRAVTDVADQLLRARSGAQINEQEFQRMKGFLFKLLDEPAVFKPSLDRLITEVQAQKGDIARSAVTPAADLLKANPSDARLAAPPQRGGGFQLNRLVPMQ